MRGLFLLMLVVLSAAASLAYLVRLDAGYVLIEMNRLSIETTVWVAALVLILALLAFYYLSRLLVICADTLTHFLGRRASRERGGWLASWRARRSNPTARGALAFAEGRWREAVRHLARGARRSEAPLLNYLLAARASEQLGDAELADGFMQLAAEVPGSAAAVRLARAESAMRRGDYREALESLEVEALDAAAEPARVWTGAGGLAAIAGVVASGGTAAPGARTQGTPRGATRRHGGACPPGIARCRGVAVRGLAGCLACDAATPA
jgi:HemY protein